MRSKHKGALPVIVTHGWPGSILHQLKIVDPLVYPTAHGGSAADAFDVVFPSMPGYGFSGRPDKAGWDPARMARAWVVLMKRLGYTKFVAQGGDWGAIVTDVMAAQGHAELVGIHTNMPGAVPPEVSKAIATGSPAPSGLSEEESRAFQKLKNLFATGVFYAFEMATRPQTLYGIADSPVSLAAWLTDLGDGDAKPAALTTAALRTPTEGQPRDRLTRDDVLDNITHRTRPRRRPPRHLHRRSLPGHPHAQTLDKPPPHRAPLLPLRPRTTITSAISPRPRRCPRLTHCSDGI